MRSKTRNTAFSLTAILAVAIATAVTTSFFQTQTVGAQQTGDDIDGDLTAPLNGMPFGGEKIGSFSITSNDNEIDVSAQVDILPSDGNVFEGWLVDAGTEYKLSLGKLEENGELDFQQSMVNPNTYNVLVITEETVSDPDPNAATPVGGFELQSPFGL